MQVVIHAERALQRRSVDAAPAVHIRIIDPGFGIAVPGVWQLIDEHNTALAVVVGAMSIGVSIIIAAAIW